MPFPIGLVVSILSSIVSQVAKQRAAKKAAAAASASGGAPAFKPFSAPEQLAAPPPQRSVRPSRRRSVVEGLIA